MSTAYTGDFLAAVLEHREWAKAHSVDLTNRFNMSMVVHLISPELGGAVNREAKARGWRRERLVREILWRVLIEGGSWTKA
jgi:hypothetical protein